MNRKTLFISIAGVLLLAFAIAATLYQPDNASLNVVERKGAPIEGPRDAKVTIVEFFDPACGTCRDFYPRVKKLLEKYPGKVRVMFRYAPLHPGSDQVVKMLEAAHKQRKFFPALELLFSTQNRWIVNHKSQPDLAQAIMGMLDLNENKFKTDMNSDEVIRIVQKDITDGKALNVRATPEYFVNGKPMPSFGFSQLSQLVDDAVAEAYQ